MAESRRGAHSSQRPISRTYIDGLFHRFLWWQGAKVPGGAHCV